MKLFKMMLWIMLVVLSLFMFGFGLAVSCRSEVLCLACLGTCILFTLIFRLCMRRLPKHEPRECDAVMHGVGVSGIRAGDIVYDLQEFDSPFPSPEVIELHVDSVVYCMNTDTKKGFFLINGRVFPEEEYCVTWCLDKNLAEELADGFRKNR